MTTRTSPCHTVLKITVALVAVALAPASMAADNVSATSTATVVSPISVTKATDLEFGKFAAGAGAGTVTVSTNGSRTASVAALFTGATPTAARFDVSGDNNATYTIALTASDLTNGANTMALAEVSDLTGAGAITGNVPTGTLNASGTQSVYVGGVLDVASNQVPGTYTGTVNIVVAYN